MADRLARFRELTSGDTRFRPGDKRDNSDNSSTGRGGVASETRNALAIVPKVTIVTKAERGKSRSAPSILQVESVVSVPAFFPGEKRDNSDNSRPAAHIVCICCGQSIDERLETLWGPDRAHRACAEDAFRREKGRGAYLPKSNVKPNGKED